MKQKKDAAPVDEGTKRVGIWVRVSTEDQARGDSPEHHEARARMYADMKGWRVVRVYSLAAVSGRTVMEHPETQAMLADVAEGRIGGLIFSKLARLARNTRELLDFAEYFQKNGADLISLAESIDTSTPAGRFFYTLIAAMSQWEREEIVDRIKASIQTRAKLGKSTGGAAPFGYKWVEDKLEVDPVEAPVRRQIYELFREHRRLKKVARVLNDSGYRTRRGKKFCDSTVRRLIQDPTAKGLRRANYTASQGNGKAWLLKDPSEWIWSAVDPVVTEELWDECNALLTNVPKGKRTGRPAVHLFTGHVFCECGGPMRVPSNSPKYICRRCRRRVPTADLETIFVEQLKGFFTSPTDVAAYLAQGEETLRHTRDLLAALQAERTKLFAEKEKLYQLYLDGGIASTEYGGKNHPLNARLTELESEIPRLQGEADYLAVCSLSGEEIVSDARSLYSHWDGLSFDERRAVVENIVQRITVYEASISFDLGYTPSAPPTIDTAAKRQRGDMDSPPRRA